MLLNLSDYTTRIPFVLKNRNLQNVFPGLTHDERIGLEPQKIAVRGGLVVVRGADLDHRFLATMFDPFTAMLPLLPWKAIDVIAD
ncbi:MAG TPA: hypothetical protein DD473_06735 [Planctomycetaceae bacterium]|nr:hypothetical protein [Planctomycetaceae bacterium]